MSVFPSTGNPFDVYASPLRRVRARKRLPNYTRDTLECGHVVTDYDCRSPIKRRCQQCLPRDKED